MKFHGCDDQLMVVMVVTIMAVVILVVSMAARMMEHFNENKFFLW